MTDTPRPRPARRSPTELTFAPDRSLLARLAATEPDWLTADRAAALGRFDELPTETNPLELRSLSSQEVINSESISVAEGWLAGLPTSNCSGVKVMGM